jgi:hypothetical protein
MADKSMPLLHGRREFGYRAKYGLPYDGIVAEPLYPGQSPPDAWLHIGARLGCKPAIRETTQKRFFK